MKGCLNRLTPIFLSLLLTTCAGSPTKKSENGIEPGYCMGTLRNRYGLSGRQALKWNDHLWLKEPKAALPRPTPEAPLSCLPLPCNTWRHVRGRETTDLLNGYLNRRVGVDPYFGAGRVARNQVGQHLSPGLVPYHLLGRSQLHPVQLGQKG